jgi:sulfate transport system permease protein
MVGTADKRLVPKRGKDRSLPSPIPVSARKPRRFRGGSVLPGFGLALGFTLLYLSLVILIPISAVFLKTATLTWEAFWHKVAAPRTLAAFRLSFLAAFAAAVINSVFGLLVAWVLERYRFPGRKLLDAMVDLPFALPTAVAGIALVTIYANNGWIGQWLEPLGIQVAYAPLGIVVALTFIGLPFVVRTVQPVLADLDPEVEEAAASLGAGRFKTFRRVILPELLPALATGFVLAFARGLGEYGSVIFISSNMPSKTEITPLLIMIQLEQYDYAGATAIASVFLCASFSLLLLINILTWRRGRRLAGGAEAR